MENCSGKHDNPNTNSSASSSESSEDEEEARKIREALWDVSICKTVKASGLNYWVNINTGRLSHKHYLPEVLWSYQMHRIKGAKRNKEAKTSLLRTGKTEKLSLKSNRLRDQNDDKDDSILQTTPEFRTYVAKQLSNMLDSVLLDTIQDGVWHVPQLRLATGSGIRLFNNSKTLCDVDLKSGAKTQQEDVKKAISETWKQRKHKLSTSSESSEDEKIKACVFTMADIKKENEYLTMLESQEAPSENGTTRVNGKSLQKSGDICQPILHETTGFTNDTSVVKKKKKKKRKKNKKEDSTNDVGEVT